MRSAGDAAGRVELQAENQLSEGATAETVSEKKQGQQNQQRAVPDEGHRLGRSQGDDHDPTDHRRGEDQGQSQQECVEQKGGDAAHESMQSTKLPDEIRAGAEREMVSVAENDLGARLADLKRCE